MKTLAKSANFGVTIMLIGTAVALLVVTLPVFGNLALIVRSASMQPTIPVGGLVVVSPQEPLLSPLSTLKVSNYSQGDVIAFKNPANQKIITTHRIVGVLEKDGKIFYQTKGDANNSPDGSLVSEGYVVGKSWILLPFVGKLIAFTKSNIGFPLLVIFPAVLVIIFETVAILKEVKKQRDLNFANPGAFLLKIVVLLFLTIFSFSQTFAFFQDSEQSTGNTFTAAEDFDEGD